MHQASWVPLTVVGVLAAMTFWLGRVAESQAPGSDAGFRHDPDYIVENFSAQTFDEHGGARYRLMAGKMVHYMDDDTTELEQPRFEREASAAPKVNVSAKRGLITADGEDVYFLGDVRVRRLGTADGPPAEMFAEYLRVMPDADIARTDKAVVMRQGGSTIEATGMFVDNERRYVQFAGRVKAVYEKKR
jgi:lipopolysaccharide export system protein LptC